VRIAVTGLKGQVARSLLERGRADKTTVVAVGRPELDLAVPVTIAKALRRAAPDIVVNAAAHTAVDQAESEPELAEAINGRGAGAVAEAAARLGVPVVHLSTDYVFDGLLDHPYVETDPVAPSGAYGRSKLLGEEAVAAANHDHAILRTAWVYSPFGNNFVKTMLRLAAQREEIGVVDDQHGSPTSALDIAEGVIRVAQNLVEHSGVPELRGVFHIAGAGEASWAEFASAIFAESARHGGPWARVKPITTAEYPTPARRPANSRLNCTKLASIHGVRLPDWRGSLRTCVSRLLADTRAQGVQG
jgi:dTDP-4-dehydrorhamnose reductase